MFTTLLRTRQEIKSHLCKPGLAPQWIVRNLETRREYHGLFALTDNNGTIQTKIAGRIVEWTQLPADVYVYDPPIQLRQHRHGRCLQLLVPGSKWFKLHWEKPAHTFDQARAYVEQMMNEAMGSALI